MNEKKKGRNHFNVLYNRLNAKPIKVSARFFHFANRNKQLYSYGNRHSNNSITSTIPPHIQSQYNPWTFCSSAQIAITKEA